MVAICDSLGEDSKDTYAAPFFNSCALTPKKIILQPMSSCLGKFQEERESIVEVAYDLETLLDKASPGIPAKIQDMESCYYLLNSLPE